MGAVHGRPEDAKRCSLGRRDSEEGADLQLFEDRHSGRDQGGTDSESERRQLPVVTHRARGETRPRLLEDLLHRRAGRLSDDEALSDGRRHDEARRCPPGQDHRGRKLGHLLGLRRELRR